MGDLCGGLGLDPADRLIWLLQSLGRVPRWPIWDNEAGIGRGKRHAEGVSAFTGTLATSSQHSNRTIRSPRGWSNAGTATSRRPSCLGATSHHRLTSTPSSVTG